MSYTFFYISKNKLDKTFFSYLHENGYDAEDCVKEEITIEEFNKKTLDAQNLFDVGIAYLVKPS